MTATASTRAVHASFRPRWCCVALAPLSAAALMVVAVIHLLIHGTPLDSGALDGVIQAVQQLAYGGLNVTDE